MRSWMPLAGLGILGLLVAAWFVRPSTANEGPPPSVTEAPPAPAPSRRAIAPARTSSKPVAQQAASRSTPDFLRRYAHGDEYKKAYAANERPKRLEPDDRSWAAARTTAQEGWRERSLEAVASIATDLEPAVADQVLEVVTDYVDTLGQARIDVASGAIERNEYRDLVRDVNREVVEDLEDVLGDPESADEVLGVVTGASNVVR